MRKTECNDDQVIRNICMALKMSEKKRDQLRAVGEITFACTSDDWVHIQCELYEGNIARYLITGTRAGMVITVNAITSEIIRKPRGIKPWYVCGIDTFVGRIFGKLETMMN